MRRTIFSCAVLLGFAGACAVAGVGCGGDDSGGGETPDSSADAAKDSSVRDTSVPDTNVPDTSTEDAADTSPPPDTSTPDTSTDAGPKDTSVADTNVPDTNVPDTNVPDTNVPDTNVPDNNVPDSNVPDTNIPDVQVPDAADASVPDTSPPVDAGPTFDNPVQIDVTAVLTQNTIVTTAPVNVAAPLTPVDGTGNGANTDYGTNAKVTQLLVGGKGLPDDAFFPAVGVVHPNVQLHWNNSQNQLNSRLVLVGAPAFMFLVPAAHYHQIALFQIGAGGSTTISVTITYTDTTTSNAMYAVADWFSDTGSANEFTLINQLDRITAGNTIDNRPNFEMTGININPDFAKTVLSVTVSNVGGNGQGTGNYVFYGAVGY